MKTIHPIPPANAPPIAWDATFGSSYPRQLLAIALAYSLGLKLTLSQLVMRSAITSKFANLLRELLEEVEKRDILRIEYQGFEPLSRLRGVILAANHPGTLDAIALISKIPHLTCLMRASLMWHPVMRGVAQMEGFIPNDVGASFIRQATQKLESGKNLLIFPEGTRTSPGTALNSFKNGFALIAVRSRSPIHTILIERTCSYLSKNVSLFVPTKLPVIIRLKAGKVFLPGPNERPRQFTLRLQNYFQSVLKFSGDAIFAQEEGT